MCHDKHHQSSIINRIRQRRFFFHRVSASISLNQSSPTTVVCVFLCKIIQNQFAISLPEASENYASKYLLNGITKYIILYTLTFDSMKKGKNDTANSEEAAKKGKETCSQRKCITISKHFVLVEYIISDWNGSIDRNMNWDTFYNRKATGTSTRYSNIKFNNPNGIKHLLLFT